MSEATQWRPTIIEQGDRIGATATLRPGAAAAVRDGDRLLLTKRSDNGQWCLPGGGVEPGERPAETAIREVLEETGLTIRVTGLLGVYSDPDLVVRYPDGDRVQIFAVCFWAEPVEGTAGVSDEVTEVGWFTASDADRLHIVATQQTIVEAAYALHPTPYYDAPLP